MRITKLIFRIDRGQIQKGFGTFGLTVLLVMFAGVAGGDEFSRTVSLKTGTLENRTITVFAGSDVSFRNDYEFSLHQASLTQIPSGKRIFNLKAFLPGESLGLEFPRQGAYEFCYWMERATVPGKSTCLQIDVVALQTT